MSATGEGKRCPECGKTFTKRPKEMPIRYRLRTFCSIGCSHANRRKKTWDDANGTKRCTRCDTWKPLDQFYPHRNGRPAPWCIPCTLVHRKGWDREHREEIRARHFSRISDLQAKMVEVVSIARSRASKRGLAFEVTAEEGMRLWEKQAGKCFYSGIEMTNINGQGRPGPHTNFSFDRIDSSKGYTIDNVVLCCLVVNRMKVEMSVDDFLYFVNAIHKHSKELCRATRV